MVVDLNREQIWEYLLNWRCSNSMLESSGSVRSEWLHFLNEYKLHHSLSSCKTFLNSAVLSEVQQNRVDAEWWFTMNLISSLLSALMFIFLSIIIARLRWSNRLRSRKAKYLPTSWKDNWSQKALYQWKKSKKWSESGNNAFPYPQVHPYHSDYHQLAKNNGHMTTTLHPGSSNNNHNG